MPWVRFTKNYDWMPSAKVMIAYRAGSVHLVKAIVALRAIAEGKAVPAERPKKVKSCHQAS